MDTLLIAMIIAAFAELGDKTNMMAMHLGQRFGGSVAVLAGIAAAATLASLFAGYAGAYAADMLMPRAASMLTGLAIVSAGAGALFPMRETEPLPARPGAGVITIFGESLARFLLRSLGDKTQFLTFALAARMEQPLLAATGATIGITVASIGPAMMGRTWLRALPLQIIRLSGGILLVVIGVYVAATAMMG